MRYLLALTLVLLSACGREPKYNTRPIWVYGENVTEAYTPEAAEEVWRLGIEALKRVMPEIEYFDFSETTVWVHGAGEQIKSPSFPEHDIRGYANCDKNEMHLETKTRGPRNWADQVDAWQWTSMVHESVHIAEDCSDPYHSSWAERGIERVLLELRGF